VLALGVALTFSEWLRGHVLTGFPWNAFGYTLASPLALAQSAALVGLWGLTFIAVLVYASPVTLADDASESTRRWLAPALAILIVAGMAAFGTMRLANTPTTIVDGVRLRIMQPNLQQDAKFNYSQKQQVMSHYIALSERADGPQSTGLGDITHLIWPESAFPFFLTREADALAQIATLLPDRTTLITGGVRPPETAPTAAVNRAYNSVYVIGHDGSILSVYDKVHLVPFGEYLPFRIISKNSASLRSPKCGAASYRGTGGESSKFHAHQTPSRWFAMRSYFQALSCLQASAQAGLSISPMTAGLA
jgi:apolipoprotein N-acyltransferase